MLRSIVPSTVRSINDQTRAMPSLFFIVTTAQSGTGAPRPVSRSRKTIVTGYDVQIWPEEEGDTRGGLDQRFRDLELAKAAVRAYFGVT